MSTYQLGGIPTRRWNRLRKITAGALLAVAAIGMIILWVTQSLWAFLAVLIAAGGGLLVWNMPTITGGRWLTDTLGEKIRQAFAKAGKWDEHDPKRAIRPWALTDHRIREVAVGDHQLALTDTGKRICTVLQIEGGGHGIRTEHSRRRRARRWTETLDAFAHPHSGVAQLDIITTVRPDNPDAYNDNDEVKDAISETSRYATYAVLHVSIQELYKRVRAMGASLSASAIDDAAVGVTAAAAQTLTSHGYPILNMLDAAHLAALIRSIINPNRSPDDLDGTEGFWPALPTWHPTELGDAVIVRDPATDEVESYVTTVSIGQDDYPVDPVGGRWLRPITLEGASAHRTVTVSYGLLSHRTARAIAKDRGVDRRAALHTQDNKGAMGDGYLEQQHEHAVALTQDIARRGHAGAAVAVTVLVASTSAQALRQDLASIEASIEQDMGATARSNDGRQAPAMLLALPFGIEIH